MIKLARISEGVQWNKRTRGYATAKSPRNTGVIPEKRNTEENGYLNKGSS